jgi:hypothetical protein
LPGSVLQAKNANDFWTNYSSEAELLLCCCRTSINSSVTNRIRSLLKQNINWISLIQISSEHGVIPLLYNSLMSSFAEETPKEILEKLHDYSYHIAIQNTILSRELLRIVKLFESNSIDVLAFKGPTLATETYGNLGLRHFSDLDLLVRKQDFLAAFNCLVADGYQPAYQWDFLDKSFEIEVRRKKSEYPLFKGSIIIDLHQDLTVERFFSSCVTFENLWKNRSSVSFFGQTIYSFGTEDLLMYLCVHGSKECWRSLKWITDVAECVYKMHDVNWEYLIVQAEEKGCRRALLLGLSLANRVLGTPLPVIINENIQKQPIIKNLSEQLERKLFDPQNCFGRKFTVEKFLLHFQMVETLRDKFGCVLDVKRPISGSLLKLVPNIHDFNFFSFKLPKKFYFLYFVIRPIRLFTKNNSHLISRFTIVRDTNEEPD